MYRKLFYLTISLLILMIAFTAFPPNTSAQDAESSNDIEALWDELPLEPDTPLSYSTGAELNIPEECRSGTITSLSLLRPWQEEVELGEVHCLAVELEAGEYVRAVMEMDDELEEVVILTVELHAPAYSKPVLQTGLSTATYTRQPLSWEASMGGPHYVILHNLYIWPETLTSVLVRVWIETVEPAALVEARREALAADRRVGWLQENALPVRSISPDDSDFSDLEFLQEVLKDVRIVMLGEADHSAGTDFLARSRLVKFLHQEMDFDVLAFEAPLYSMDVAWDSIRVGAPVRDALRIGLWGFWSHAEQMQSLVRYIGEQAAGDRPLEVAGFDYRPWIYPSTRNTPPLFARDLAGFLREQGMETPLADSTSSEYGILEVLAAQSGFENVPDPEEQAAFFRALVEAVVELENSQADEGPFWAEALRGVRCHTRVGVGSVDDTAPQCFRSEQMGRHLLWLANERYQDRKIIAWAATGHVSRDHAGIAGYRPGPAMGKPVWDALGDESYAIGTVSYRGTENQIVTDQHPLPEFEQVMEAAGFDYALVDLRAAAREGSWLGGTFLARPYGHHTEERRWSDILDALLFVREQEPRRQIEVEPDAAGGMP
jgi:erythromycin esterase